MTNTENTSNNPHISDIIKEMFSNPTRRSFLKGGSAFFTAAAGTTLAGCASGDDDPYTLPTQLSFAAVAKNTADKITLPPGYQYTVVHATGDRLVSSLPVYSNRGLYRDWETDRKSTRLNSSHSAKSRMPSSA